MTELIDRIVERAGIERPVAEKAVGTILEFLSREGPPEKVQALLARLPGHEALIDAAGGGGLFGGMGGIMGVGAKMMGMGLGMTDIQNILRELMAYCREHGAEDALSDIAAAIPGLNQYV
jgi:hypothetical protein